jgi:putative ABC transport system permease protein
MYPELTTPLLVLVGAAAGLILFLLIRRPVLRRLALRQVMRRPTEGVLVILGSLLGTALIVASFVVGDSLNRSVRQSAYDVLGPVDEYVRSSSVALGDQVARRLEPLRADPRVDGLLTARGEFAAAVHDASGVPVAEPRTLVWELDFADAARFGAPHPSGLSVAGPARGQVLINDNLAASLQAKVGDTVTFYLYGRPVELRVARIVPAHGLAGVGLGATTNRNAYLSTSTGTLLAAAHAAGREPATTTFISNSGGVEGGAKLTDELTGEIRRALGPLAASGAGIWTPKQVVLDSADETGATLGSLFLFIGSFSIIAGVLLIVNIYVMLAEERRGQLGIMRAIGMRRRRVTAEFAIEGALYSAAAAVVGAALGIVVGRVVVTLAMQIMNGWDQGDNHLTVAFAVTPTSIINGTSAGFLIAFVAVVLTSVRIARTNIIAAIRDQEASPRRHTRRRMRVMSGATAMLLAAAAVPPVVSSAGAATYLLPALALVAAVPLLRSFFPPRRVTTWVAAAVLGWGLLANIARPDVFDDGSTTTYIVQGSMLALAAVALISEHQSAIVRPLRRLIERPTQLGLATRLAVAYPTAKRFRTGATLGMYCIVVLVIVLLAQISAIVQGGVKQAVTEASAGWSMRADFSPTAPVVNAEDAVRAGPFKGEVLDAAALVTATADGEDPAGRRSGLLPVLAIGVPEKLASTAPKVDKWLPTLPNGQAAWNLILRDPRYVLVDSFYGSTGGPQGEVVHVGDKITLTDPRTGVRTPRTVAGLLGSAAAFYGLGTGEFRNPILMSVAGAVSLFGGDVRETSLLLRIAPGVDLGSLAARLQAAFLANGLVVSDIGHEVEAGFAASNQFFRLMQGYLALGLLVGIAGLDVVMVRAVRERRRTIGVLRALGFRAQTVHRAFMAESTLLAVEGVVTGTVLGVLTTWLLFQNSAAFATLDASFPIAWTPITVTVLSTLLASLLVTARPAHRAAQVKPAVALRVAD